MENLQEFVMLINRHKYILIGIFVIIFICFLTALWKRRKKTEEEGRHAKRRMREDALERALANHMIPPNEADKGDGRRPFKVDYRKDEREQVKLKQGNRMYQLTENNELSERKYMFWCSEHVFIGNQFGSITILSDGNASKQAYCQIFLSGKECCVKSTGVKTANLIRKKKQAIINQTGIKLHSGDIICIEKTRFRIDFV